MRECPLWVISGHYPASASCPLYPDSGHSSVQVGYPKSQQRTSRVLKSPEVTPLAVAKPNSCPSKAPATRMEFLSPANTVRSHAREAAKASE